MKYCHEGQRGQEDCSVFKYSLPKAEGHSILRYRKLSRQSTWQLGFITAHESPWPSVAMSVFWSHRCLYASLEEMEHYPW